MTRPNTWTIIARFESKSHPGKFYTVKQNGTLGCDCPAFKFQRKPIQDRFCKHTRAVMAEREVAALPAETREAALTARVRPLGVHRKSEGAWIEL